MTKKLYPIIASDQFIDQLYPDFREALWGDDLYRNYEREPDVLNLKEFIRVRMLEIHNEIQAKMDAALKIGALHRYAGGQGSELLQVLGQDEVSFGNVYEEWCRNPNIHIQSFSQKVAYQCISTVTGAVRLNDKNQKVFGRPPSRIYINIFKKIDREWSEYKNDAQYPVKFEARNGVETPYDRFVTATAVELKARAQHEPEIGPATNGFDPLRVANQIRYYFKGEKAVRTHPFTSTN